MPIHCITGIPGAGKTQLALAEALTMAGVVDHSSVEAIQQGMRAAKRPLYIWGVEGLVPWLPELADAMAWQDLPDGSVVLVDEAWKVWGSHLAGVGRDPRYLALAEHRHRGFDFIITSQDPAQLQTHVKVLSGPHDHVSRKFGTKLTMVWTWPTVQGRPESDAAKNRGMERQWSYNKVIHDLYQSATLHTIKRKIPKKLIAALLALPLIAVAAIVAGKALTSIGSNAAESGNVAAESVKGSSSVAAAAKPLTAKEWEAQFMPRWSHLPMSAPAYDGREVVAEPRIACAIGYAGVDANGEHQPRSCTCITEQGTRWEMPSEQCETVVWSGGAYDPFKAPARNAERAPVPPQSALQPGSDAPPGRGVVGVGSSAPEAQQAGYGAFRGLQQSPAP
jgi:hypothetical protein